MSDSSPAGHQPHRIDVHHHYLPSCYRAALAAAGLDSVSGSPFPSWSPDGMIGRLDELQVRTAAVSVSAPGVGFGPPAGRPALARASNEEGAALQQAYPGRVRLLATLPLPDVDAALSEVAYSLDELGAAGFILLTNHDGVYLSDPRLEPVLAELDRRGALVLAHPAVPPGAGELPMTLPPAFVEFSFDTTRTFVDLIIRGVIDRFPRIRFILSHLGGALPFLAWRLGMLEVSERRPAVQWQQHHRAFADYLRHFWYDTATCGPATIAAAASVVGMDRLVFGSDAPFGPPLFTDRTAAALDGCGELDAGDKQAISSGTARLLLGL
jgi:6-methylsalicylate decarboxylase